MGIIPWPVACQSKEEEEESSYAQSHRLYPQSSSLSSQSSLPSVPSLTSHTQQPPNHHRCIATLKGHSSYIFSLAHDAKHLYSGSYNGEIRCWSLDGMGTWIPITPPGKSAVKSILLYGGNLFNAHQDHKIRVWKVDSNENQNPKLLVTLPTVKDRILRFLPPKNHVRIRRHKKSTWVHHVDAISGLALSKDGSLLYSVSWDRTLKIWRTSDFRCLQSVANAHDDAINAVAVSGDGFVYTGSADMTIKLWRKTSSSQGKIRHSLLATLEKHKSAVNALALSSDGSTLYSGACDRSIVVWERSEDNSMAVVGALRGHGKAILCLAAVSETVCSGSADKTVRIWRRGVEKGYTCLAVLEGHTGPVKCLALTAVVDDSSSDPSKLCASNLVIYSGSLDCDIKVWRVGRLA